VGWSVISGNNVTLPTAIGGRGANVRYNGVSQESNNALFGERSLS
jgi:hypothetical protein